MSELIGPGASELRIQRAAETRDIIQDIRKAVDFGDASDSEVIVKALLFYRNWLYE